MKLSEIAKEAGVPVCKLTAKAIKSAGKIGLISENKAEELLVELDKADGNGRNDKEEENCGKL